MLRAAKLKGGLTFANCQFVRKVHIPPHLQRLHYHKSPDCAVVPWLDFHATSSTFLLRQGRVLQPVFCPAACCCPRKRVYQRQIRAWVAPLPDSLTTWRPNLASGWRELIARHFFCTEVSSICDFCLAMQMVDFKISSTSHWGRLSKWETCGRYLNGLLNACA